MRAATVERFWAKVAIPADVMTGCWLWGAMKDPRGYGRFNLDKGPRLAHRIAYTLVKGAIPGGLGLDHLCRAHGCVNPAHLEPVTQRENVRRGLTRGHSWNAGIGADHGMAKLTEEQALRIKALAAAGELTRRQIGAMFGVSHVQVCNIANGKSWSHLPKQ